MDRTDSQPPLNVNVIVAKTAGRPKLMDRLKHLGKVVLFVVTFGFAFPNVLLD